MGKQAFLKDTLDTEQVQMCYLTFTLCYAYVTFTLCYVNVRLRNIFLSFTYNDEDSDDDNDHDDNND